MAIRSARIVAYLVLFSVSFGGTLLADRAVQPTDQQWSLSMKAARKALHKDLDAALMAYEAAQRHAEVFDGSASDRKTNTASLAALASRLGLPVDAIRHYDDAIALHDGPEDLYMLAHLAEQQAVLLEARGDLERAEQRRRLAVRSRGVDDKSSDRQLSSAITRLTDLIAKLRFDDPEVEELLTRNLELDDPAAAHKKLGDYYGEHRDHDRAIEHLELRLDIARTNAKKPWMIGRAMADLARAFQAAGRLDEAAVLFDRVGEIRRGELGDRHLQVAGADKDLAGVYIDQERFAEAETILHEALAIKKGAYGQCDPCTRDVVVMLMQVYDALGREIDFCGTADQAPAETAPEADSVDAQLAGLDASATQARSRREYAAALRTAQQALALRETTYGFDALELAATLDLIANLEADLGRGAARDAARRRLLGILELHLDANHPAIARTVQHLGREAEIRKDWSAARDYYAREVGIREALEQNYMAARGLKRLAKASDESGDDRAAGEQFLRAARLWESMGGTDMREYVLAMLDVARTYRSLGLPDEAQDVLTTLVEHEERRDVLREQTLLAVLRSMQAHYQSVGAADRAEELAQRIGALADPS